MEKLKDIVSRQQERSPEYFDDPEKDRMMALILSLAEEVCVLRDRLDSCRLLAEANQTATDANIESLDVSAAVEEERLRRHTEFFESALARVQRGPPD
jgi:hypothetical protein